MPFALRDCTFIGPALPEPFVKFELERQLAKLSPLPKETGPEARALQEQWEVCRRRLRALGESGGDIRVLHHVVEPLAPMLGYGALQREEKVRTREGDEDGGWWMPTPDGKAGLRAWTVALGTDLDAPNRRGRAYRFSPARVAARVLLAKGERAGLLTDGVELRLLLCDPARPDSHIAIALDRTGGWRGSRDAPDSLRLLLALARPRGVAALPEIIEAARLSQTTVTRKLREQARNAVRDFVQGVLDEPANAGKLQATDLAKVLWEEGLIVVYRLLFVLKMESSADPSRAFSFAATSLWRNSYSPNTALAPVVAAALAGTDTGGFLEQSLRTLFRLFSEGLESAELRVSPLGGALFGARTTPALDGLSWGERAVAHLLDALLWTPGEKKTERERVHYGALDVEDLGRVYEALLELEPGITAGPMCRLRRAKLEVVVPAAQGAPYRANAAADDGEDEEPEEEEDESPKKGKGKTKVAWVEDIPAGRFFLRTGLGRKSSGSYYTPHPFVRFLVQETLGPQVAERSPQADPQPLRILALRVLDPAMGSGHFLVEACRFLGDALYEACRLCDERASAAEEAGDVASAAQLRARVEALPDPNNELLDWLPSRAPEGTAGGLSQQRAQALCRRLVAVHCLYGVDKNRLAVELAKLSLWLESYAEGLPLTFMDHRLVCGDSLTGPFLEHLFTWPKTGGPIDDLLTQGLRGRLTAALAGALAGVRDLTASVGKDVADLEQKAAAKARLDAALAPFRTLAAVWAGAVMLGDEGDDGAYLRAVKAVAAGTALPVEPRLQGMIDVGGGGVVYDLAFPEVFHPDGRVERAGGFDAVVGNPPWDTIELAEDAFWGGLDLRALEVTNSALRKSIIRDILAAYPTAGARYGAEMALVTGLLTFLSKCYLHQTAVVDGSSTVGRPDMYRAFVERAIEICRPAGSAGLLVPSALHTNEGATGLRRLLLSECSLRFCASFENRAKLFEIDSRMKFDAIVAVRDSDGTTSFKAGFYLVDPSILFTDEVPLLVYSRKLVEALGGPMIAFPECRDAKNASLFAAVAATAPRRLDSTPCGGMRTGIELPRHPEFNNVLSPGAPIPDRHLPVLEGKCMGQFAERSGSQPRISAPLAVAASSERWRGAIGHYRLAYRAVASSTNERTILACLLTPGDLCNHSLAVEMLPNRRPANAVLSLLSWMNSHALDWQARQRVDKNVSAFIVRELRLPPLLPVRERFLAHSALRLTCNHAGYAPLWSEQVGDAWREPAPKHTWPVLAGDDARWAVRAAIDAVVADAYGLSREQYAHVLGSFSHKSYPKAPALCLAAFDELKSIGLDAFVKKHDPYHDIPLNEALPKPVIDFSAPVANPPEPAAGMGALFSGLGRSNG